MRLFLLVLILYVVLFGFVLRAEPPKVYSSDDTYLGDMSNNTMDPDSINNPYGIYGNVFNPNSVNNIFSPYSNQFSPTSINNPYAFPEVETDNVLEDYLGE